MSNETFLLFASNMLLGFFLTYVNLHTKEGSGIYIFTSIFIVATICVAVFIIGVSL